MASAGPSVRPNSAKVATVSSRRTRRSKTTTPPARCPGDGCRASGPSCHGSYNGLSKPGRDRYSRVVGRLRLLVARSPRDSRRHRCSGLMQQRAPTVNPRGDCRSRTKAGARGVAVATSPEHHDHDCRPTIAAVSQAPTCKPALRAWSRRNAEAGRRRFARSKEKSAACHVLTNSAIRTLGRVRVPWCGRGWFRGQRSVRPARRDHDSGWAMASVSRSFRGVGGRSVIRCYSCAVAGGWARCTKSPIRSAIAGHNPRGRSCPMSAKTTSSASGTASAVARPPLTLTSGS